MIELTFLPNPIAFITCIVWRIILRIFIFFQRRIKTNGLRLYYLSLLVFLRMMKSVVNNQTTYLCRKFFFFPFKMLYPFRLWGTRPFHTFLSLFFYWLQVNLTKKLPLLGRVLPFVHSNMSRKFIAVYLPSIFTVNVKLYTFFLNYLSEKLKLFIF